MRRIRTAARRDSQRGLSELPTRTDAGEIVRAWDLHQTRSNSLILVRAVALMRDSDHICLASFSIQTTCEPTGHGF